MASILQVAIPLVVLLTSTLAEEPCPTNCKCDYKMVEAASCHLQDSNVTIKLSYLTYISGNAIIECQNTKVACSELPQFGKINVRQLLIRSCAPNILRCVQHMLADSKIDAITFDYMTEPVTVEDVKNLTDIIYLDFTLNDTSIVPIAVINSLPSLHFAAMRKGNLELQSDTFNNLKLRKLEFYSSNINIWSEDAFSGLPNLKELSMFDGKTDRQSINIGTFRGLNKLQKIKFMRLPIKTIEVGAFEDTPNLETLHLDLCPFESLPNKFLQGLKSLNTITLTCVPTEDRIQLNLGSHAFANQPKLKVVEFGYCKLDNLPENLFFNSSSLARVDIGDNILKSISPKTFSGLFSLTSLSLNNNTLQDLPDGIFASLTSLNYLSLANNRIVNLEKDIFRKFTALHTLKLDYNKIQNLDEGIFNTLTSLNTLNLARNDLTELPENIFVTLTSLETLNLNNNNILVLPERIFIPLTLLETLDLQNNKIKELPEKIFGNLIIESLDLSNNSLRELPERLFTDLNLVNLNLSNNCLPELDKSKFPNVMHLYT